MTHPTMPALAALLAAAAAVVSVPAHAQVNGIAIADTAVAVAQTTAFQAAYQQIAAQYEPQRQTIEQRQQQRQQLVQGLDANADGQLSDEEAAAAPEATVQQVQALDQELAQIQQPIQRARIYVVSQIAQQYSAAVQQVIAARSIQLMIAPEAVVYAPDAANVTQAVTDALNTLVPSVPVEVPADFQPTQAGAQLTQQIQQLLVLSALQQQQQQPAAAGR